MNRRLVASNESSSSEDSFENNLIEELNEEEEVPFSSPRKRLRSNAQAEEESKSKDISASGFSEEIYYDEEDFTSVLTGKFKPDPFGLRSSRRSNNEREATEPQERPQRRTRRTKKFEAHLDDYEDNFLNDHFGSKRSRATADYSDEYESSEEVSEAKNVKSDQSEEEGEYTSSESDASFVPNNETDVKVSDDEMNAESEVQAAAEQSDSSECDIEDLDLNTGRRIRPRNTATKSNGSRKTEEPASEIDENSEKELDLDDISVSSEQERPHKVTPSKRKREISSDDEAEDYSAAKHENKRPRVYLKDNNDAAEASEQSEFAADSAEEKESVDKAESSENESIELESQAEEDSESGDDDFEVIYL